MESDNPKQTIFISHATPEDNLFVLWLASRLSVLGYLVWVDLKNLGGGEDSWGKIEKIIRKEAVKFVFVVSNQSINKQGVLKELALADRLKIENFIIPIKIDKVPPQDFPAEIVRKNCLDFSNSWADGIVELLKAFEQDTVPKSNSPDQNIITSLESSLNFNNNRLIKNKHEIYYSNWFEFGLPENIHVYQIENPDSINLDNIPYRVKLENDYIISFACPQCMQDSLRFIQFESVVTDEFLDGKNYQLSQRDVLIKDVNNKVVELMNYCFGDFMLSKGLAKYELANGECFFIPWKSSNQLSYPKTSLKKYGRRPIQLVGKNLNLNWHFALEGNAFFHPVGAYAVSHHIVFTEEGIVVDTAKQHARRRSLGSRWYNKKWRDLLLGFMIWLSEEDSETIDMPICKHFSVKLNSSPVTFQSHVGYIEPDKSTSEEENE